MRPTLFTLLTLFWAAPALAEPVVYSILETDGVVRFCQAETLYPDSRKISFSFSPRHEINITLTIPNGHFQKDRRYDLDLTLDNLTPRKIRVIATSAEVLLLEMGASPSFVKDLGDSSSLSLGSKSKQLVFPLPHMPSLLNALRQCAGSQGNTLPPQPALPDQPTVLAPLSPPPESLPESTEGDTPFTPQRLLSFLKKAGLKDIALVSMDDIPQEDRVADYLWQSGFVLGGLRQQTVPEGAALSELVGLHLKGLKEKCGGSFKAVIQKEQISSHALLRYAEAKCAFEKETKLPTVVVAVLFSLTPQRDFSVFTHEGVEKDKTEILAARDKIGKLLLHIQSVR